MPTQLKQIGPPEIGQSIAYGAQASTDIPPTTPNNRIVTRLYEMRAEDTSNYVVSLQNPTLYDSVYTNAVIVQQSVFEKPNDLATCYLRRVFAEIPSTWDDSVDRNELFFGVAKSMLYEPGDFRFRNGRISQLVRCRLNQRYFLGNPSSVIEAKKFQPVDADGVAVDVIDDYTTPSADEYIAMVAGRKEIVLWSVVKKWMGDIHVLETLYAPAQ